MLHSNAKKHIFSIGRRKGDRRIESFPWMGGIAPFGKGRALLKGRKRLLRSWKMNKMAKGRKVSLNAAEKCDLQKTFGGSSRKNA